MRGYRRPGAPQAAILEAGSEGAPDGLFAATLAYPHYKADQIGSVPWPRTPRMCWSSRAWPPGAPERPEHSYSRSMRIPALYADAHIPGAIGFDWQKDLQDQVRRDFLGHNASGRCSLERDLKRPHDRAVWDRNNWFAAYTYWYLKYYGHNEVLLLNGPREKWIADGRARARADLPASPTAELHCEDPVTRRSARDARRSSMRDRRPGSARRRTLPRGVRWGCDLALRVYEQEGAQRAGHIPGAASIRGRRRSTRMAPSSR